MLVSALLMGCPDDGPILPVDDAATPLTDVIASDTSLDSARDAFTNDAADAPIDTASRDITDVSLPDVSPTDVSLSDASLDALTDALTDARIDAPDVLDAARDAPSLDAPTIDTPAIDSPAVDTPTIDSPAIDSPAVDSPAVDTITRVDVAPDRVCSPVTVTPDVDPWRMSLASAGAPTMRMVTAGAHRDVYLRGPGGIAEIGVRLDWGGSVVFFGQAGVPSSNTIDGGDTGRELQLAIYDPTRIAQSCAHDASCTGVNPCGASITYLGWNPVQGGDECGHGARVLRNELVGDQLIVAVRPLQWNPDWNAPDCRRSTCAAAGTEVAVTYTLGFRFVHTNVVEVDRQVSSEESFSHPETEQEFPTLYVGNGMNGSTDLPVLLTSASAPVSIDLPANDGFTYRNFTSAAGWVTWQHSARDYGVALAMDHFGGDFQAWAGSGSGAPYFHNVRPRQRFGLTAGAAVRGRAYLALGSEATVRSLMTALASQRAPFGVIDSPRTTDSTVVTGTTLHVSGWALDNTALDSVTVRLDDRVVGTLPRAQSRADVCAMYPNYAGCPRAGFDGDVSIGAADGCSHLLTVVARDSDGNETVLGRRLVMH